ncbi:DUF5336 domain-containing protein [Amycolatopsis cihanbeyliensis]|uniref:34 kDa antigenic protein n=1 Tax=Amycolatopsis cihanbeyliensis TaxID=1128664 RepID=A0A542DIY5_AMYCI|nr:DUF5336 domain-containing protein [Amycolatopsis cihanbeyliensis]TQJ03071.1 hypothetical protein FB471_2821 [Amycolatopsis cihanbeyliensis]
MTFPSSGPGYSPQGGGPQQQPPQGPGSGPFPPQTPPGQQGGGAIGTLNIAVLLGLAVTVLGLVQYFMGFSDEASLAGWATVYLLVAGLLAALRVLPNGPKVMPFVALFSVLGAFQSVDAMVGIGENAETPGIMIVVLILGILQMLVAVAALLFDHNVLKLPAPRPQAPYSPYGQPYGQQPQHPQGPPSGAFNQPTTYGPPVTPGASPGQQPTQYASQQGQFYQEQQQEPGRKPETPPGGSNQPG